jgi:hypothetical protein
VGGEVAVGAALQHDVVELRSAVDPHGVALVGQELERLGDAQRIGAGELRNSYCPSSLLYTVVRTALGAPVAP